MARVKAETELEAERRSIADKVRSQEELQQSLKEQFRTLAGDVLGEQSRRFKEENRESMDIILKPFKDNISEFRSRVDAIFTQQTEQSGALKNELQRLMELNKQITTETTNLTNALKGNSKVQGDWGEMILESILDNSNLIRGVHYQTQLNVKDEAGNNLRPDVVLNLPNNKQVIIDSKVSLTAYVNYVSAESEAERRAAMTAHVASVRQHVKELGAKSYQQLLNSPDFVIMFIPNEPAFLDALKEDNTIWNDAYEKKVIISSPTNLFALLKIVDDLWRRDEQNKNHENIIKLGVTLYDQLVAFSTTLEGVGTSLEQAQAKYDEAYKRLHTGNNNIVRVGEKLRKMGLPTTKKQSAKLVELSEEGAEDDATLEITSATN
jgi:DNA recombination protein RmuC